MKHSIITFYTEKDSLHLKEAGSITILDEKVVDEILAMKIFEGGLQALFEYNGTEYMTTTNFQFKNNDSLVEYVRKLAQSEGIPSIEMYSCFDFSFPAEYISKLSNFKIIDLSEPVKSYRVDPLSNILDDFINGNLNEDEINEAITTFDNIKKSINPK